MSSFTVIRKRKFVKVSANCQEASELLDVNTAVD